MFIALLFLLLLYRLRALYYEDKFATRFGFFKVGEDFGYRAAHALLVHL